jgi:hypothetical protein
MIKFSREETFRCAGAVEYCAKDIEKSHKNHVVQCDSLSCQLDLFFKVEVKKEIG